MVRLRCLVDSAYLSCPSISNAALTYYHARHHVAGHNSVTPPQLRLVTREFWLSLAPGGNVMCRRCGGTLHAGAWFFTPLTGVVCDTPFQQKNTTAGFTGHDEDKELGLVKAPYCTSPRSQAAVLRSRAGRSPRHWLRLRAPGKTAVVGRIPDPRVARDGAEDARTRTALVHRFSETAGSCSARRASGRLG